MRVDETETTHALMWLRSDVPGSELVVVDESDHGLAVRGSQQAVDPIPYRLQYELWTDATWAATRFVATCEGAGWSRELTLERGAGGWTAMGAAHGRGELAAFDGVRVRPPAEPGISDPDSLASALDLDLGGSPLTNSLPVHRLGLLGRPVGHVSQIVSAWVLPPTLEVIASPQTYTVLAEDLVEYGDAGTGVAVRYDAQGWVLDYPGLARRAQQ